MVKRSAYNIALAVLILALPGLTLFGGCSSPNSSVEAKAAIVDQLYSLEPNQAFIDQMTQVLEAGGFKVDVYQGEQVSVKFYRELPRYGYKLIIFRTHSGILQEEQDSQVVMMQTTYLFTDEGYNETKYVLEQLTDQMVWAKMTEDYPIVFAINSKFVTESMDGKFDNTAIIMMGCSTTYQSDMAIAFVVKGASTYIGWDASVSLDYVDGATINLIQRLLLDNLTVEEAVAATIDEKGRDPFFDAILKYYPSGSGNQTIKELIKGEEN